MAFLDRQPFADALADLIEDYDDDPVDDLIEVLEAHIRNLKAERADATDAS